MTETTKYNAEGLLSYMFLRRGILFFLTLLFLYNYKLTESYNSTNKFRIPFIQIYQLFCHICFIIPSLSFSSIAYTQILTHTFFPLNY